MARPPGIAAPMSASDALDIVHELACLNRIDAEAAACDGGLEALACWQGRALDTVADLLFLHDWQLDAFSPAPCLAALAHTGVDGCTRWDLRVWLAASVRP